MATAEEGCQEGALQKQVEKKRRKKRRTDKEASGMKLLKKWWSVKEKAGEHENAKLTSQRTVGQNVKQGCDCS